MSRFSGKCDLFNHILMEKMYDKGNCKVSDELECFNIFKQKTGGKIYQEFKVELTKQNFDNFMRIENEKENSHYKFDKIINTIEISDRRCKSGIRKVDEITYSIEYFGKTYTAKNLKDLNKQVNYYYTRTIEFDNIFDIVKYYPYIVTVAYCDGDREYIVIANDSYTEKEFEYRLQYGYVSPMNPYYNHELQQHYYELVKEYGDDLFNTCYVSDESKLK